MLLVATSLAETVGAPLDASSFVQVLLAATVLSGIALFGLAVWQDGPEIA